MGSSSAICGMDISKIFELPPTSNTPLKIKIEPENDGWEDDFPFPRVLFSGSSR